MILTTLTPMYTLDIHAKEKTYKNRQLKSTFLVCASCLRSIWKHHERRRRERKKHKTFLVRCPEEVP